MKSKWLNLAIKNPNKIVRNYVWRPFTVSKDDMLMSSFRHSALFRVSPSSAWYTFHLFNFNPIAIQCKSKSIQVFLFFHCDTLDLSFIVHTIHMVLNHSLKCFLNCCLIFNVSMHVSFSRLDHVISEDKNILYLNCSASILTNNE